MNTQEERLVSSILEHKKIETEELFNYLISKKALEKLEDFKIQVGSNMFKGAE